MNTIATMSKKFLGYASHPFRLGILLALLAPVGCNDFMTKDIRLGVKDAENPDNPDNPDPDTDDNDQDGLSAVVEEEFNLGAGKADSDHDGYSDGLEFVSIAGDPLDPQKVPLRANRSKNLASAASDPLDNDNDGLGNAFEVEVELDPSDPDVDGDGYSDGLELVAQSDPFRSGEVPERNTPPAGDILQGSDPADLDGDGLSDDTERFSGTTPGESDSDSDGFSDGIEFLMGSDANDPINIPNFTVPKPDTTVD